MERYRRRIFHVYVLFRPDTGHPCYIGKGRGKRWASHKNRSSNRLVTKLIRELGQLPAVKVRDGLTEKEAFEIERALIKAIGRLKDGGPLLNVADGGQGAAGAVRSIETCKRISLAKKGNGKGQKRPPEWCAAIKAGLRASPRRKVTDVWRKNISQAKLGGTRKFSARGPHPKEHCSAISVGVSDYWERYRTDPNVRAARKAGIPVRKGSGLK